MVAAARGQKLAAPACPPALLVLQRHFQRHLYRHRAGIGKKHAFKPRRHEAQQPFGQGHGGLVREAAKHHMGHAPGLTVQGVHEAWMVVTVHGSPPRGHAVHKLPALCQHNAVGVGAANSTEHGRLRGRRIGMPHGLMVAVHKRLLTLCPQLRSTFRSIFRAMSRTMSRTIAG